MPRKLRNKHRVILIVSPVLVILLALVWYFHSHPVAVLDPAGQIGLKERHLMIIAILLSAIVVLPVYTMTILIAWNYRASNKKAKYTPNWDHSRLYESIWWGIPIVIISVLCVITWNSSHALDPFKPIASSVQPLNIQVVALDWKWLFIYPQQHIATVNFFQIPKQTPINFELTSDAPMNSFWIPQLGGQIYAMPGMSTQLHLMASVDGAFHGSSANISGDGFSGMTFMAKASSQADFERWVESVQRTPQNLNQSTYNKLAAPSENNPVALYTADDNGLYNGIINKYMLPAGQTTGTGSGGQAASTGGMSGMDMSGMGAQ